MDRVVYVIGIAAVAIGTPTKVDDLRRDASSIAPLRLTCGFAGKDIDVTYTSKRLRFVTSPVLPMTAAKKDGDRLRFKARAKVYSAEGEMSERPWITVGDVGSAQQEMRCSRRTVPRPNVSVGPERL